MGELYNPAGAYPLALATLSPTAGDNPYTNALLYYRFTTLSANDLNPIGGNVYPLTLIGGSVLNASVGLPLDGATQYGNATGDAAWNIGTGGFAVFAWVRATVGAQRYAVWKYGNSANNAFGLGVTAGGAVLGYMRDNAGQVLTVSTGAAVTTGALTHIGFVRNGTTITTYKNGVQVGTATNAAFSNLALGTNTYPLTVGALRSTAGAYSSLWASSIRQVTIFTEAVSAAKMTLLFATGY